MEAWYDRLIQSKAGRLKLIYEDQGYRTVKENEFREYKDELVTAFENGKIIREYDFEEIRDRVASYKSEKFSVH
jgi:nicotinamide phosphoribosyltransferase